MKITSLKVKQPTVDQRELAAVLGEYKNRYQRSRQEAEDVLQEQEARQAFLGRIPNPEFDQRNLFRNPFQEKEK